MCARCDTRPTARRRTCSSACRCSSDSGPILTTVSALPSGWPTLYHSDSCLSSVQVLRARAEGRVPIEDTALGMITFEDGSLLEFCAAVSQQLERSQIELAGEKGAVQAFPWAVYSAHPATNAELAH